MAERRPLVLVSGVTQELPATDTVAGCQPIDSDLTALAGLSTTGLIERTGTGTAGIVTVTTAGKALLDDDDAAAQRTTLGVGTGDSPQFTAINLGHASDTTLARSDAGKVTIEGVEITTTSNTQTLTNKTLTGLRETKTAPSISAGTLTLDCAAGNVFAVALNASITTLAFSNVPATGTAYGCTLELIADGTPRTITWGSSVKWPGGTAPTLTSTNGKVDRVVLTTHDGGTTWYATNAGQNY